MPNVLIVGAGVAGCACAYYLRKKGVRPVLLEATSNLGGMAHTYEHVFENDKHLYEFGPHVWFWPNDDLNEDLRELTDGKLREIDRRLYTFTTDGHLHRYPIHMRDVEEMPDANTILAELAEHRCGDPWTLGNMPKMGECSFEEYFKAAVGPTLYARFMEQYTQKMWGIPGSELDTKMVWADRIKDHYTKATYDPIKFEDHSLGQGQPNWYPEGGWNKVWSRMVGDCEVLYNTPVSGYWDIPNSKSWDTIIWTLHSDLFFGHSDLPAMGRIVLPIVLPRIKTIFGAWAESLHYADTTPVTRITEMGRITGAHGSESTMLVVEVPIASGARLPANVMLPQHIQERCYNLQSNNAREMHETYVRSAQRRLPVLFCGRHANFKYYGMPEVVESAKKLVEEIG